VWKKKEKKTNKKKLSNDTERVNKIILTYNPPLLQLTKVLKPLYSKGIFRRKKNNVHQTVGTRQSHLYACLVANAFSGVERDAA
jgi:hypothetical protein